MRKEIAVSVRPVFATALAFLTAAIACAQSDYERPASKTVSEVLGDVPLKGPGYELEENVVSDGVMNRYTFQTSSGTYLVTGNEQALERMREYAVVQSLAQVKGTDAYKDGLKASGKGMYTGMKSLFTKPGETLSSAGEGVGRFFGNAYRSMKPGRGSEYDEGTMKGMLGFADAKRAIAFEAGVNPYSTNPDLQAELDDVAWASFAGGATLNVAKFVVVPAPIAIPMNVGQITNEMSTVIRDESPESLQKINADKLRELGMDKKFVNDFISHDWYSPAHQTILTEAISRMRGVGGLDSFIQAAMTAVSESEAFFFQRNAEMLAAVHASIPLSNLTMNGAFPIAQARDGGLHMVLAIDTLHWTSNVDAASKRIREALPEGSASKEIHLWIGGTVSERAKSGLTDAGFDVRQGALKTLIGNGSGQ